MIVVGRPESRVAEISSSSLVNKGSASHSFIFISASKLNDLVRIGFLDSLHDLALLLIL